MMGRVLLARVEVGLGRRWGEGVTPSDLAAGVPCGLRGRGSSSPGSGWLWWEQTVFTPSRTPCPRSACSQGLSHPRLSVQSAHFQLLLQSPFPQRGGAYCPGALPQPRTLLQESPSTQVPSLSLGLHFRRPLPQPTSSPHVGQGRLFRAWRGLSFRSWP